MKINDKLKLAMARYYHNRDSQYTEHRVEGLSFTTVKVLNEKNSKKWDKEGDRDEISRLAQAAGFECSAAPGTFWFSRGNFLIECNESNYLDGGVKTKRPKNRWKERTT
jgi:hypothetical protein